MDGGLDVLGDGGGALVVAGLVLVEPPHVIRLQGARVAQLVGQPPAPRHRRLPSSSDSDSDSDSYTAVHLHHHCLRKSERAAAGNGGEEGLGRTEKKQRKGRRQWGFAFGLFMPRREKERASERERERNDDDLWMPLRPQAQVWLLCHWEVAGKGLPGPRMTNVPSGFSSLFFCCQGCL